MKDRPLRILVGADTDIDPNSGAAGTVYATNRALRELGHEVAEVWGKDLPHRIRHWNLHYLLELPRAYRDVVRQRTRAWRADVIQLSQPHAWLAARDHRRSNRHSVFVNRSHGLESLADAALACWKTRQGVRPKSFPRRWASAVMRKALHAHIDRVVRFADGLIVPAEEIRQHLVAAHGADPSRIAVVHHGVPDAFLDQAPAPMTATRAKRLLNIGQYSEIKGPRLLAEAVEQALSMDRDLSFTWVCASADHARARELFRKEFQARVNLRPWADQRSLLDYLDTHGIFVAHSVYEGAAKACTEAMARGLAVVSSAVGALQDHVRHGDVARLVAVGDVDGMASEICALARSPSAAAALGERAAKLAAGWRWRNCAEQSVRFYRTLCRA